MARRVSIAAVALLVIVAGSLLAGEWVLHRRSQETCGICQRHINPKSAVVAEVGGHTRLVCCAHCAVTEGLQEHKPVRLIQVTDYNSGRKLDPARAWYVDGSRIVACEHDMSRMGEMKQMEHATFDRCSPGTFAFGTRAEADSFVAANGGAVRSLNEMLDAVNQEVQP